MMTTASTLNQSVTKPASSEPAPANFRARWEIRGTLTTNAPLHVGNGQLCEKAALFDREAGRKIQVNGVFRDARGLPCVPASALRGVVRHRLQSAWPDQASIDRSFGYQRTQTDPQPGEQKLAARGTEIEFHDARIGDWLPALDFEVAPPCWDKATLTGVEANVALDPATKTARPEKLFHTEFVPPGVPVEVRITGESADGLPLANEQHPVRLLLWALGQFNHNQNRLALGANTGNGWGRCSWKLTDIRCLDRQGVIEWLRSNADTVGYAALRSIPKSERDELENLSASLPLLSADATPERAGRVNGNNRRVTLELRLDFDGPLLVKSTQPPKAKQADDNGVPDAAPRLDKDGRVLLPASSIRGAFRARAEYILKTLEGDQPVTAAVESVPPTSSPTPPSPNSREDPDFQKILGALSNAELVFGATGWRSPIELTDFLTPATDRPILIQQEFVAIDRFTGGAAADWSPNLGIKGWKFNLQYAWRPTLLGKITLDLRRWNDAGVAKWAPGLIALTLRDLIEGDIPIGLGASKGFGACRAAITAGDDENWRQTAAEATKELRRLFPLPPASSPVQETNCAEPAITAISTPAQAPLHGSPSLFRSADDLFHNPYHFVPVSSKPSLENCPTPVANPARDQASRRVLPPHVAHDRAVPGTHSGRLLCRLQAVTALVVGDKQETDKKKKKPTLVRQFERDERPAIPASSLRGLISSVAEAASNSALRVLSQAILSYRKPREAGLSALGMIKIRANEKSGDGCTQGTHSKYFLRPLTLPHLQKRKGDPHFSLTAALPNAGKYTTEMFPQPNLKTYIGSFYSIRTAGFKETFLNYDPSRQDRFYGMRCRKPGVSWADSTLGTIDYQTNPARLHVRETKHKDFLLAREPVVPKEQPQRWEAIPEPDRPKYIRGILRVLGVDNDPEGRGQIPSDPVHGKQHEIFIPYTEEMEHEFESPHPFPGKWREFEIPQAVIDQFHQLADQRTEDDPQFPFELYNTRPAGYRDGRGSARFRLQDGDIVFFRPDETGQSIAEVSISSIWRGRVNDGAQHAADLARFLAEINPDLTPLGVLPADSPNTKEHLTLAELLFGFVEQRRLDEKKADAEAPSTRQPLRALASRLRFGYGLPHEHRPPRWLHEGYRTLKILASPKPPSPPLYFKPKQGDSFIKKEDLAPTLHAPQGRKFYLHALSEQVRSLFWQTDPKSDPKANHLKAAVRPLEPGSEFWFHIDFDNLSELELGLLCYAVRPTPPFRHKLGFGKPLGLGSVRLDPAALLLVQRQHRYRGQPWTGDPRWSEAWTSSNQELAPAKWPARYDRERSFATASASPSHLTFDQFHAAFLRAAKSAFPEIILALETLGNPESVHFPVHYPQLKGRTGPHLETELFKWWQENEKGPRQHLPPLPWSENPQELPPLRRI